MNGTWARAQQKRFSRPMTAILLALFAAGFLAATAVTAGEIDWQGLRGSVVDLEVRHANQESPVMAVGFCLAGIDGIVTCYRLVNGAELVTARPASGPAIEITEYIACDPAADLIVLKGAPKTDGLPQGSPGLLALGQTTFAPTPPSHPQPTEAFWHGRTFAAAGLGDAVAIYPLTQNFDVDLSGAPLTDSLGHAVGIIEILTEGVTSAACAIPISRVSDLLARPELGGALLDLATTPAAAWTRAKTPQHRQVMGAALCRVRKISDGTVFLNHAVEKDPLMVAALIELGMSHQMQGEHTQAESYYRKALEIDPTHARTRLYLGSCLFMQGMYLKAQFEYEAAIDADPTWATPYVNLGGLFVQQRKPQAGEEYMRKALDLDPLLGIAHCNLGVILYTQGQRGEAREKLDFLRAKRSGYAARLERQMNPPQSGR